MSKFLAFFPKLLSHLTLIQCIITSTSLVINCWSTFKFYTLKKIMIITSRSSISSYLCPCYMVISKIETSTVRKVFFVWFILLSLNYKIWSVKKPVVRKHNYFLSVFLFFLPKPLMEFHSKSNTKEHFVSLWNCWY